MTGVHFDTSQVDRLAVDLTEAPKRVRRAASRTMRRSATSIKHRMQAEFAGHRYAPEVPLSFELRKLDGEGLSYEIGELNSAGPQWGLAAILAYGTSNNAPVADHRKALREEAPFMAARLASDAADSVLGGDR